MLYYNWLDTQGLNLYIPRQKNTFLSTNQPNQLNQLDNNSTRAKSKERRARLPNKFGAYTESIYDILNGKEKVL